MPEVQPADWVSRGLTQAQAIELARVLGIVVDPAITRKSRRWFPPAIGRPVHLFDQVILLSPNDAEWSLEPARDRAGREHVRLATSSDDVVIETSVPDSEVLLLERVAYDIRDDHSGNVRFTLVVGADRIELPPDAGAITSFVPVGPSTTVTLRAAQSEHDTDTHGVGWLDGMALNAEVVRDALRRHFDLVQFRLDIDKRGHFTLNGDDLLYDHGKKTRPITLRAREGRFLLALARGRNAPLVPEDVITHVRKALEKPTDLALTVRSEGTGEDRTLRLSHDCAFGDRLRAHIRQTG